MSMAKKYYYMKLQSGFFGDPKIRKLRSLPAGDSYLVVMLKMMLATIKEGGVYVYEGIEDRIEDELALVLDEDKTEVKIVLDFMFKFQMIEEINDKELLFVEAANNIGSESDSAERMRRHRKRKQLIKQDTKTIASHCDGGVTDEKHEVTNSDAYIEIDIELEKDIEKDSLSRTRAQERMKYLDFVDFIREKHQGKVLDIGKLLCREGEMDYAESTKFKFDEYGMLCKVLGENHTEITGKEAKEVFRLLYDQYYEKLLV